MINALRKDAIELKKEHERYSDRMIVIDHQMSLLKEEREEIRLKAVYTWDRMKHVEKMIERAER